LGGVAIQKVDGIVDRFGQNLCTSFPVIPAIGRFISHAGRKSLVGKNTLMKGVELLAIFDQSRIPFFVVDLDTTICVYRCRDSIDSRTLEGLPSDVL
jgi:hypothetical protein